MRLLQFLWSETPPMGGVVVGNSVRSHGVAVTLVGMGVDAVPACHRQGPILQPGRIAVCLPVSWDSGKDSYYNHRIDATSVM